MAFVSMTDINDKGEIYNNIEKNLCSLLKEETDFIANLSNFSALIGFLLKEINWAGFYLLKNNELVLGPFFGKPAVSRIKIGDGVCGSAIKHNKNYIVPNVCEFPGHITCDIISRSEIIIQIVKDDVVLGVLDIDSPILNRFDKVDEERLTILLNILIKSSDI
jgi:GAF domain-containing protein